MAVDMKELIGKQATVLLFEKKVKKLTVKDIVEGCGITRQAFYYHFSDIPDLLRWLMEQRSDDLLTQCRKAGDMEAQLRQFLRLSANAHPTVKTGLESNYGPELERLIRQNFQNLFSRLVQEQGLLESCAPFQREWFLRYHTQAIQGILRSWEPEDTKNLDQIAHAIYCVMSKGFSL